jgi:menaquinone-dependent protoporphyrinogen oxidase
MPQKLLVTYATRAGSTAEIATVVADRLKARGLAVDLLPVEAVSSLSGYRAVVMGSAVRFSQWLPEAVQFVEAHRAELNERPLAAFSVYLMNRGVEPEAVKARRAYLDAVRRLVTPEAEGEFTGVGDLEKVAFCERLIGRLVKSPEGDFRDWAAIRAWADGLPSLL